MGTSQIILDPIRIAERKAKNIRRYHVLYVPAMRLVGFTVLSILVIVHNNLSATPLHGDLVTLVLGMIFAYTFISWALLYPLYTRCKLFDLGFFFLCCDIVVFLCFIYLSGGDKSWLYFILVSRVIDQSNISYKRAVFFSHFIAAAYLALMVFLVGVEHREISWPIEFLKVAILYFFNIYISIVSKDTVTNRRKLSTTMALARDELVKRKEVEKQLRSAKSKAEAANEAKSSFLANMSHEIRTPMNGVIGFTDILMDSGLNKEQTEYAKTIKNSGQTLLSLINDILDLSKIEADELDLETVELNLADIANNVCNLILPQIGNNPIQIKCRVDEDIPTAVIGDPLRIRQVLTNLMGNAVKFTEAGEIGLSIDLESQNETHLRYHAVVRDTGLGIPEEKLALIFNTFQQADGSTSRRFGGTGLGLSICKRIAQMMDGDVWAESTLGKGSTFHFSGAVERMDAIAENTNTHSDCPIPKQEQLSAQSFSGAANNDAVRILLAEDKVINQKLVTFLLCEAGFNVEVANNGTEAVEKYLTTPDRWNLILMDLQMPELDGLAATKRIRAKGYEAVPIIALTAHAMKEDKERCLNAGMNDYLTKPIIKEHLIAIITEYVLERKTDGKASIPMRLT